MERPSQFRDPQLDTSGEVIGFYPREFFMLDNFSAFQVDYMDRRWPTSEHAYHAAKFVTTAPEVVEQIYAARSPHDALKIAQLYKDERAENWDEVKVEVMYEICKLKLMQNLYIQRKLLDTAHMTIVEDSPKDDFWGWGPDRDGRNELGEIWMRLRDELRDGHIESPFVEPDNYDPRGPYDEVWHDALERMSAVASFEEDTLVMEISLIKDADELASRREAVRETITVESYFFLTISEHIKRTNG